MRVSIEGCMYVINLELRENINEREIGTRSVWCNKNIQTQVMLRCSPIKLRITSFMRSENSQADVQWCFGGAPIYQGWQTLRFLWTKDLKF